MSYPIAFYHLKTKQAPHRGNARRCACLPQSKRLQLAFSQLAYPERTVEGSCLRKWEEHFQRDGYALVT